MSADRARWHTRHDHPDNSLVQRLAAVQEQIRRALDRAQPGPARLLSLRAGDGPDVLQVLAEHPRS